MCLGTKSSVVFRTRLERKMCLRSNGFLLVQPSRTQPKADLQMVLDLSSVWDQGPVLTYNPLLTHLQHSNVLFSLDSLHTLAYNLCARHLIQGFWLSTACPCVSSSRQPALVKGKGTAVANQLLSQELINGLNYH